MTIDLAGMIFYQIQSTTRQSSALDGPDLWAPVAIMIESAAVQTVLNLAVLLSFQRGLSSAVPAILSSAVPAILTGVGPVIYGISTVLINVRVGLGWAIAGKQLS
ncbi:hypothetical protein C8F01DRAFT_1249014 [Mycena amicta]|nr:hypothetical protein C8F01DRAFT_1249014 [Mycena amicta]